MIGTSKSLGVAHLHDDRLPFVTVIMPVRNEAAYIERSLGAVLGQSYPAERLEVILADGMSTDATRDLVTSVQARHPNVRLLNNPEKIVSTALNRAIDAARGEIIVRVDGHCEIDREYVRRCVEILESGDVDGVGGRYQAVGETLTARAIAAAMSSRFGVGGAAARIGDGQPMLADTVFLPAYRRAVLERAGQFDEELIRNQDDEYNYRLRKLGMRLRLAGNLRARYYGRGSLISLWHQYFQYGFWKVRVAQKHPRQMQPRQLVPPTFVTTLLGLSSLAVFSQRARRVLWVAAGAYATANLAASCRVARETSWQHLPILPAAFAVMHCSYGLGFLVGLVKFRQRWR